MGAAVAKAQDAAVKLDGGLAPISDKKSPERDGRIVPPGALSVSRFYRLCTACQLCVSSCPNGVLHASADLEHFLQPQMGYENGWCRPECTTCSELCPAGAIGPVSREEKSGIKIGTAAVNPELCISALGEEHCGNCARHCPTGAILMVKDETTGHKRPVVSEEQCIGCGACEYLCPVRPVSAISVNGLSNHQVK